ncbi:hypothetical protein ACQKL0_03375 [Peribacillus sp. NPDC097264]|uniref:hypothetical protein n=1 Tax=Peribacillus sp. NPDC097264 TaxID=3390616 RepID=UPI003D05C37B
MGILKKVLGFTKKESESLLGSKTKVVHSQTNTNIEVEENAETKRIIEEFKEKNRNSKADLEDAKAAFLKKHSQDNTNTKVENTTERILEEYKEKMRNSEVDMANTKAAFLKMHSQDNEDTESEKNQVEDSDLSYSEEDNNTRSAAFAEWNKANMNSIMNAFDKK